MIPMSKYALMAGTVAAAVGIGFFMQNSPSAQSRYGTGIEVASLSPDLPSGTLTAIAVVSDVVEDDASALAATLDTLPPEPAAQPADPVAVDPVEMAALDPVTDPAPRPVLSEPVAPCEARLAAVATDAAMVDLTLTSCQPLTRATIHHNGMMVQGLTDMQGTLRMTLPALADVALFIAEFPDREGAVATTSVPALAAFDRVVLQWRGDSGFALNAFEFDARSGSDGHRFRDTPGTLQAAVAGMTGVMTQHGVAGPDKGLRAEAYSFARSTTQRTGRIAFSVEAAVTEANCGKDIAAQSLQISAGTGLEVRELTIAMPDCGAVGDYIVLNNMAEDLNIAAN